ncbi:MAG TPA: GNAT family N-acetyltransferase [Gaiellaceae bacterium]|nr:GNAT family N-acetyltransferase [Gaiellaceae bacterium]
MRLETERLVLRPLTLGDLVGLTSFYGDPEVMRFMGGGGPVDALQTRASLERMIATFEAEGFGQLAVERKEDGSFMGRCGLFVWDTASWTPTRVLDSKGPVEVEVGWLLGHGYWGHGYATEAAVAVRDWALGDLGRERLISLIYAENARSIAVARKLGMELEGEVELFGNPVTVYALGKRPAR